MNGKLKYHSEPKGHVKDLIYVVSDCCQANVSTLPACFGDPSMDICNKCNTECDIMNLPVYENVSQGTYRKIEYDFIKNGN